MPGMALCTDDLCPAHLQHLACYGHFRFCARGHNDPAVQRAAFPDNLLNTWVNHFWQPSCFHEQVCAHAFGNLQHALCKVLFHGVDVVISAKLQGNLTAVFLGFRDDHLRSPSTFQNRTGSQANRATSQNHHPVSGADATTAFNHGVVSYTSWLH